MDCHSIGKMPIHSSFVLEVCLVRGHLPVPAIPQSTMCPQSDRPGLGWPTHLKLFFISRSLAMMATGSVSPVTFWIMGSCPFVSWERDATGTVGKSVPAAS